MKLLTLHWTLYTPPAIMLTMHDDKTIQRSTLTFEGTCQVGQVNINFYLLTKIFTCPAKGVIECTWKWLFCMYYTFTNKPFSWNNCWWNIGFTLCYSISEAAWWVQTSPCVNPLTAGGQFDHSKVIWQSWQITETLTHWYSSHSTLQELSNKHQHDRVKTSFWACFRVLCLRQK